MEKELPHIIAQLIKDRRMDPPGAQIRITDAVPKRGTCQDMCPEYVRVRRIAQDDDIKLPEMVMYSPVKIVDQ